MYRTVIRDFSLRTTAESGQCFRMLPAGGNAFTVAAMGRLLEVTGLPGGEFLFDCSPEEYEGVWRGYFDLDTDYGRFYSAVPPDDPFLSRAVAFSRGLRILRQDPWETLVSFILSQRRNLPSIRRCVENLCASFGERRDAGGRNFFAFPSPEALAAQGPERLAGCSLGYRAGYVHGTALAVASGRVDLGALAGADDAELLRVLCTLPGVGVKVASCVLLFGYHRLDAFPVDVWISRVEREVYGGAFPRERYPGFAGVLQQCLFFYARSGGSAPEAC